MTARSEMRRLWKAYMKKTGRKIPFTQYVELAFRIAENANTHMEK